MAEAKDRQADRDGRSFNVNLDWVPLPLSLILFVFLGALYNFVPQPILLRAPAYVTSGAIAGYVVAKYRISLSESWICLYFKSSDDNQTELHDIKMKGYVEGHFLAVCSILLTAYILFYLYSSFQMAGPLPEGAPGIASIPDAVAIVTGLMVGVMAYFTVRYAAFIRMARLLAAVLAQTPDNLRLIKGLRRAVFRDEQMHEPPGNIFVTIGIAATFLGLAIGLVHLDLRTLFSAGDGLEGNFDAGADAASILAEESVNQEDALSMLRSFMGCMGLALGVSMLGVMTALAAQWLRGHGPDGTTEELLNAARLRIAALEQAPGAGEEDDAAANEKPKAPKK